MKTKVLSCDGNLLCVLVDGIAYNFHLGHAKPLTSRDMRLLMDQNMISSSLVSTIMYPVERFDSKLSKLWHGFVSQMRKRDTNLYINTQWVLNYIREHALPMDIDGEECYVLTPGMMHKLEKGDLK